MPAGAIPLSAYPHDEVALACSKCSRFGRYRKTSLIAIHGAEIGLPDLRTKISAGCPKIRHAIVERFEGEVPTINSSS